MRPLVVVEALAVAAFVAVSAYAVVDRAPPLPTIDAAALAVGATEERWSGIFLGEQQVGWAVSREAATAEGGRVFQQQSSLMINAMGSVQRVVTAGTAVVDENDVLRSFDFVISSPMTVFARGELRGRSLHVELDQAGQVQTLDIPVKEAPVLSLTLPTRLRGRVLNPGDRFDVPYFDPITLTNATATVRVEAPEVLPNGESAFWIRSTFGAVETRRLVDANGETLREESAPGSGLGMSSRRMTREEALAVSDLPPPDLVALAAAPLEGSLGEARDTRVVALRVSGVEASRFASDPPLQVVEGDVVRVSVPMLEELPSLPVAEEGPWTEPTFSLPAAHPEIVQRAREVVRDAPDRLEAVRRLNRFVFDYVQKVPTVGVPNGLEVLRQGKGDCNEHTALFVSLARAVGIPSRIAAGLVYSTRLGDAFYYHAWPEVKLGGPTEWVPVDPTFGQLPADATHLKVVNGDLDRQIEIMGMMGKVRLSVVEAR